MIAYQNKEVLDILKNHFPEIDIKEILKIFDGEVNYYEYSSKEEMVKYINENITNCLDISIIPIYGANRVMLNPFNIKRDKVLIMFGRELRGYYSE